MDTLRNIFNVNKGDIISIVGSGGKTSLLFNLAKNLKKDYNVLVTTSTKIRKPSLDQCDYLYTDVNSYIEYNLNNPSTKNNAITVISKSIIEYEDKQKLVGIDDFDLDKIYKNFDITLIEADGSRRLPLKGWKSYEPCILKKTNKTIGIIPIDVLNRKVNSDFIYGFEEFNKITDYKEYIDFETIGKICSNESGIFKNSKGELYFYINKIDTKEDAEKAMGLSKYLKENIVGNPFKFKICFGSFKGGFYYEY